MSKKDSMHDSIYTKYRVIVINFLTLHPNRQLREIVKFMSDVEADITPSIEKASNLPTIK